MNCANSLRYGTANEPIYLLNIKIEYDENGMAWPLVVKLKKLQLILVSFFLRMLLILLLLGCHLLFN
jgi:hypothetical protein